MSKITNKYQYYLQAIKGPIEYKKNKQELLNNKPIYFVERRIDAFSQFVTEQYLLPIAKTVYLEGGTFVSKLLGNKKLEIALTDPISTEGLISIFEKTHKIAHPIAKKIPNPIFNNLDTFRIALAQHIDLMAKDASTVLKAFGKLKKYATKSSWMRLKTFRYYLMNVSTILLKKITIVGAQIFKGFKQTNYQTALENKALVLETYRGDLYDSAVYGDLNKIEKKETKLRKLLIGLLANQLALKTIKISVQIATRITLCYLTYYGAQKVLEQIPVTTREKLYLDPIAKWINYTSYPLVKYFLLYEAFSPLVTGIKNQYIENYNPKNYTLTYEKSILKAVYNVFFFVKKVKKL